MERLTKTDDYCKDYCPDYRLCEEKGSCRIWDYYHRLSELEDKLESGELVSLIEAIQPTNGRYTKKDGTYYEKALKRLQDLENKLESGRLVELLCKPMTIEELKALKRNDWIWLIESGHGIYRVVQYSTDLDIYVSSPCAELKTYSYSDYGTKWIAYKNKEQAEARLKKLEEKRNG